MREINKTIYEILKVSDPDEEDISVTQLITDEVVKQSHSGEIAASRKGDAAGLLDQKALDLISEEVENSNSSASKKQIKASGKKVRSPDAEDEVEGSKKLVTKKKAKKVAKTRTAKPAPPKKETDLTKILLGLTIVALVGYLYVKLMM